MRKILTLMLAAGMLLSSFGGVTVLAAGETAVNDYAMFETFNNATVVPSAFSSGSKYAMSVENSSTDSSITDVFRKQGFLKYTYSGTGWVDHLVTFPNQVAWQENGRTEIEFDVSGEAPSNTRSYFQIRFNDNVRQYIIGLNSKKVYSYTTVGSKLGELSDNLSGINYTGGTMTKVRFKFVFDDVTYTVSGDDTTTYKGRELMHMYVDKYDGNGSVDVIKDNRANLTDNRNTGVTAASGVGISNPYLWLASDVDHKELSLKDCGNIAKMNIMPGGAGTNFCVDDISVISYNKTTEIPVSRGELRAAIEAAEAERAASSDTAYQTMLQALIDDAMAVYSNAAATQAQIEKQIAKLNIDYISARHNQIWDTFNDGNIPAGYTLTNSNFTAFTVDSSKYADDHTMQGALRYNRIPAIDSTATADNYTRFYRQGFSIPATAEECGKNFFAEVEMDIFIDRGENSSNASRHTAIALCDKSKGTGGGSRLEMATLWIEHNGTIKLNRHSNYSAIAGTTITGHKWDYSKSNRVKFVLQMTDEEGKLANKIDRIEINGIDILDGNGAALLNNRANAAAVPANLDCIYFFINGMTDGDTYTMYLDNLKIGSYNKKNLTDASPLVDNYALADEIRNKTFEQSYMTGNTNYDSVRDAFDTNFIALKAAYDNKALDYSAELAEAEAQTGIVSAIENLGLADLTIADENNNVVDVIADAAKIKTATVFKKNSSAAKGDLIVAIYNGDELYNVKMVNLNDTLSEMSVGEKENIRIEMPLPENKENLTIKALLFEDVKGGDITPVTWKTISK